jgi:hypothetical protein
MNKVKPKEKSIRKDLYPVKSKREVMANTKESLPELVFVPSSRWCINAV